MEIIEEYLSLFKGNKFLDLIKTIQEKDKCSELVKDLNVDINGTSYNYFSKIYQNLRMEEIANLLLDLEVYLKKTMWFYGDSICSICDPNQQQYYFANDSKDITCLLYTSPSPRD